MSSRDRLLGSVARRYQVIDVAGDTYRIQSLTEGEWSRINAMKEEDNRAAFVAAVLVDEAGRRLFDDKEIELVKSLDLAVTGSIFAQGMKHCQSRVSTEEMEKN